MTTPNNAQKRDWKGPIEVAFRRPRDLGNNSMPFSRVTTTNVDGLPGYPTAAWVPEEFEPVACMYFLNRKGTAATLYPIDANGNPDIDLTSRPEQESLKRFQGFMAMVPRRVKTTKAQDGTDMLWCVCPLSGAMAHIHDPVPEDRKMWFHPGKASVWHANSTQKSEREIALYDEPEEHTNFWLLLGIVDDTTPTADELQEIYDARMEASDQDLFVNDSQLEAGDIGVENHAARRRELMAYRAQLDKAYEQCLEAIGGANPNKPIHLAASPVEVIDNKAAKNTTWYRRRLADHLKEDAVRSTKTATAKPVRTNAQSATRKELRAVIKGVNIPEGDRRNLEQALWDAGVKTANQINEKNINDLIPIKMTLASGNSGTIGQKRANQLKNAAQKYKQPAA